jgi:hypothetical protein
MTVRLLDLQLIYGVAGAREHFERLCAQLIRSKFPNGKGVRVHQGDGGVDTSVGNWADSGGIHVFQVKFFPTGLGTDQKKQVRESLKACIANPRFTTTKWTLCLPVDLSKDEIPWFNNWKEDNATDTLTNDNIDYWGATELEGLLFIPENNGILEAFFQQEHLTQIREIHSMLAKLIDDISLRLRVPTFVFGFNNNQEVSTTVSCSCHEDDKLNAQILSQVFTDEYVPRQVIEQQKEFERILSQSRGRAPEYQLREYIKAYQEYLEELEPALKRKWMQQFGRICYLAFVLKNVGTAPANDLKIMLHFPVGTLGIDIEEAQKEITIPHEPKAAWMNPPLGWLSSGQINFGALRVNPNAFALRLDPILHLLRAQYDAQPQRRGPLCNNTRDSHIVTYTAPKLHHEDHWSMPPVVAYLHPDEKQEFSIRYSISANELPKKEEGTLHVQWKREPSSNESNPLRERLLRRINP